MTDAPLTVCTNCGQKLAEEYCARCGERQPGHQDLSVGHFVHDVVHEFVHLDSKLFRTLRDLVVRPGFVTEEYFAGRKSRYIPPLRLFLTLFALQFLAFTLYAPVSSLEKFDKASPMTKLFNKTGGLTKLIEKAALKRHLTPEEFEQRVDEQWHKNNTLLQFMNILGVALVLKVLYYRRYLVEHLVFAAHFLAFSYIMALVVKLPIYAVAGFEPGPLQKLVSAITITVMLVYLFFAQRRFYSDSRASTVFKTVLLWGGQTAVTGFLLGGSLVTAIVMVK
ncbi:MAG TPA: DUF3667 domain-containing protein [Thermoanaerobaculia bacterium]|jgi:hypothetical protein|nr:DUF3667 domain-containing protein [Thermoanaerobaculia bacterium]